MSRNPHGVMPFLFLIAFQKVRMPCPNKNSDNFITSFLKKRHGNGAIHASRKSNENSFFNHVNKIILDIFLYWLDVH